jgi:hypothetical protein
MFFGWLPSSLKGVPSNARSLLTFMAICFTGIGVVGETFEPSVIKGSPLNCVGFVVTGSVALWYVGHGGGAGADGGQVGGDQAVPG